MVMKCHICTTRGKPHVQAPPSPFKFKFKNGRGGGMKAPIFKKDRPTSGFAVCAG